MAVDTEAQTLDQTQRPKEGGWITFPFIIGFVASLSLANGGWLANLIIYLIKEFNIKNINATLIANLVNGSIFIFPVVGAVIADSFMGSFSVILVSSCISLLGIVALTLTATMDSLRPQPCNNNVSNICESPSILQYSVLYLGLILACIGIGGTRFTTAAMGANQFKNTKDQDTFFNYFIFTLYVVFAVSWTAIVYIEDNVSWGLGFGISIAANVVGLAVFLSGKHFYRLDRPQGSPFTALVRVLVAAIRKRSAELPVSLTIGNFYYDQHEERVGKMVDTIPSKNFRWLNRAALKTERDINSDGSIAKPWRLCKVQEVEDLKTILKIFPIWSSGIFISTPIAIQGSLTILQVQTMDRHLGPKFEIPSGSFLVIIFLSTSIFIFPIEKFLYPLWQKFIKNPITPLQRLGLAHILNILSIFVAALVESKRLKIVHHFQGKPDKAMLSLWIFPQLVLIGIVEAFNFPAQVGFYYQEFPLSLRSTATAVFSMLLGIAFYLSTALNDLIRRVTRWLPDDINEGRLDMVYWTIFVLGLLNFGYFLVCAKRYKYHNIEKGLKGDSAAEN